jgi:hypothetical protein
MISRCIREYNLVGQGYRRFRHRLGAVPLVRLNLHINRLMCSDAVPNGYCGKAWESYLLA